MGNLARMARIFGLLGVMFALPSMGFAQGFPQRPIRLVVPSAPSTPPDLVSRLLAAELQRAHGWVLVIENKAGALQTIAAQDVARSPADGYSIFVPSMVISAVPALLPNARVNIERDFVPVARLSVSYNALVVPAQFPASTLPQLIDLLKKNPDKYNYLSGGFGTPAHLVGELFKNEVKISATHVPYAQFPQALTDLLSGQSQYMFATTLPIISLVEAGNLKALAVTSKTRLPSLKNVPTLAELGLPQLSVEDWVGWLMPKGTPSEIVEKINTAVNEALARPEVRQALQRIGSEPAGGTSAAFGTFLQEQVATWTKVVTDTGIKMPN